MDTDRTITETNQRASRWSGLRQRVALCGVLVASTAVCPVVAGVAEPASALPVEAPLPSNGVEACMEVPEGLRIVELPEAPDPGPLAEVEDPEVPDEPDVPDDPEAPDVPDVPDVPEEPEAPDVPEEPEAPDVAEVPGSELLGEDDDVDSEEWVVVGGEVEPTETTTVDGTSDRSTSEVVVVVDPSPAVPARVRPAFTG